MFIKLADCVSYLFDLYSRGFFRGCRLFLPIFFFWFGCVTCVRMVCVRVSDSDMSPCMHAMHMANVRPTRRQMHRRTKLALFGVLFGTVAFVATVLFVAG